MFPNFKAFEICFLVVSLLIFILSSNSLLIEAALIVPSSLKSNFLDLISVKAVVDDAGVTIDGTRLDCLDNNCFIF